MTKQKKQKNTMSTTQSRSSTKKTAPAESTPGLKSTNVESLKNHTSNGAATSAVLAEVPSTDGEKKNPVILSFLLRVREDQSTDLRIIDNKIEANHFSIAITISKSLTKLLNSMYEAVEAKKSESSK